MPIRLRRCSASMEFPNFWSTGMRPPTFVSPWNCETGPMSSFSEWKRTGWTAHPKNIHDMVITPKTKEVKVWLSNADVGLEFSFERITMEELEERLNQDRTRQDATASEQMRKNLASMPEEQREFIKRSLDESRRLQRDLPIGAADLVGSFVKRWTRENCTMDDGLIPFLNVEQMALYFHGQRITVKDGIANSIYYSASFGNKEGAVNLRCQCLTCSPR